MSAIWIPACLAHAPEPWCLVGDRARAKIGELEWSEENAKTALHLCRELCALYANGYPLASASARGSDPTVAQGLVARALDERELNYGDLIDAYQLRSQIEETEAITLEQITSVVHGRLPSFVRATAEAITEWLSNNGRGRIDGPALLEVIRAHWERVDPELQRRLLLLSQLLGEGALDFYDEVLASPHASSDVRGIVEANRARASGSSLHLLAKLRDVGPYEDWIAEPRREAAKRLPVLVVARRLAPRSDEAEAQRLDRAARVALELGHQNVVQCFGMMQTEDSIAQIVEALDGLDLERAISRSGGVDVRLASWIGIAIARTLAHAHAQSKGHGHLEPEHVILTRNGLLKIDFGFGVEAKDASVLDVRATAAIIWQLLTGASYDQADRAPYAPTGRAPGSLERLLEEALSKSDRRRLDAEGLASRLERIFYAELDGDDGRDGSAAAVEWIARVAAPEAALFALHRAHDSEESSAPTKIDSDSFARLLSELEQPVRPTALTRDDADATSGGWEAGVEIATRVDLFPAMHAAFGEPRPAAATVRRQRDRTTLSWTVAALATGAVAVIVVLLRAFALP